MTGTKLCQLFKSNRPCSRPTGSIEQKRVMSAAAHRYGLAPGQHDSEEKSYSV